VLSGHGTGQVLYGPNGHIEPRCLARLAAAMPRAAAHVEHVFVAACYFGGAAQIEQLLATFPNLRTVHGYAAAAPAEDVSGMRAWEIATRGGSARRAALAGGASWTRSGGFSATEVPLGIARANVARLDVYDRCFDGEEACPDPHSGPLRDYYTALRALAARSDLDANERAALLARADRTLRLCYYAAETAPRFAKSHASALRAGFGAVGERAPDFGHLSRQQALAAISAFENKLAEVPAPPAAALESLRLLRALRDLDPIVLPLPGE
jgi:hypothetical protein